MELDLTEAKTRALDITHSAAMRNPDLRRNANRWWSGQRQEAEWATSDDRLEREAAQVGLSYTAGKAEEGVEDGRLLSKVRNASRELGKLAWGWQDVETKPVVSQETPDSVPSQSPSQASLRT
jgi:hypothetical protein